MRVHERQVRCHEPDVQRPGLCPCLVDAPVEPVHGDVGDGAVVLVVGGFAGADIVADHAVFDWYLRQRIAD